MTEAKQLWSATGRRKTAVARTRLKPGNGTIIVNNRSLDDYFGRETLKMILAQPFKLTQTEGQFDVLVNVKGGGLSGQADAIKHGITKTLVQYDAKFRPVLKKSGFITRDSRVKERKKYGQRGARARFQFSKR